MHLLKTCAAAAALIFAAAGSAAAAPAAKKAAPAPVATQPAAAQPAPPPIAHGPTIPGLCVYRDGQAIQTSLVGKSFLARMQQLRAQVTAELQAEQTALQTDISAFQAKRSTLTPDQISAQGQPLQQRAQAFDAKAGQRQRELEATAQEQLAQIHQRIDGILRTIYQQHGCSILLNGDQSVIVDKPEMDVSAAAVQQLDAVMPSITFDRKILPLQAQQ
jgi:outer membrane protein